MSDLARLIAQEEALIDTELEQLGLNYTPTARGFKPPALSPALLPLLGVAALTKIVSEQKKLNAYELRNKHKNLPLKEAHPELFNKLDKRFAMPPKKIPGKTKKKYPGMFPDRPTLGGSSSGVTRSPMNTYRLSQPSTSGGLTRNRQMFSSAARNGLIISHCEPLTTLGMTTLGALNYVTLPLMPSQFAYLNYIVNNFSKWTWLKLALYYVPSCPTSTGGECAMGLYYDEQDASSASFIQTAQLKGGISFPPWGGGAEYGNQAVRIDINCREFDKPRYAYAGAGTFAALTASDKNNYSPVNLAIATQGSAVQVTIAGRLWCEYTIQMVDPISASINA